MEIPVVRSSPEAWVDQLLSSKAARRGAVVRRSLVWVDCEAGRDRLEWELRRRNYQLIRTADQFIVICNSDPVEVMF